MKNRSGKNRVPQAPRYCGRGRLSLRQNGFGNRAIFVINSSYRSVHSVGDLERNYSAEP